MRSPLPPPDPDPTPTRAIASQQPADQPTSAAEEGSGSATDCGPGQLNRGNGFGGPGMMDAGPQNGQRNGPDRRGMGQRPFGQDGGSDGSSPAVPGPVVPTPTS